MDNKPIFLIGYMASGKSSLGKKLARLLGRDFIDLDRLIEEQEAKSINTIFAEKGEEHFRQLEKNLLNTLDFTNAVVATGGGTPCFFDNMEVLKGKGTVIYLELALPNLIGRLRQQKENRPLIKDIADEALSDFVTEHFSVREKFYLQANLAVKAEWKDLKEFATNGEFNS